MLMMTRQLKVGDGVRMTPALEMKVMTTTTAKTTTATKTKTMMAMMVAMMAMMISR